MTSGPERQAGVAVRPRSNLRTVILWAVLITAVTAVGWALLREDGGGTVGSAPASTAAVPDGDGSRPAGPPPASGFLTRSDQDPRLDRAYQDCATAFGFDPAGVQVLVGDGAVPWGVKTGRDVPAAIHRSCLQAIGGPDPRLSSHGNP